jgi:hypothetical protein
VNLHIQALAGLGLLALLACSGSPAMQEVRHPVDPVIDMLHRGIIDLEENVDELNERIAELQKLPPVPDPTIQELRALDLSEWQLHQQQWLVQRDRLFFAVHQIERAQAHPSKRPISGLNGRLDSSSSSQLSRIFALNDMHWNGNDWW